MDPAPPLSPAPLFQIGTGFMASRFLFTASELGVFSVLADGALGLGQLAERLNIPVRTCRMMVDANVALGLLQRTDAGYTNAPLAAAYLAGRGPADLRPMLRILGSFCAPRWQHLTRSVRTGEAVTAGTAMTDEEARIWSEGVEAFTLGTALALPGAFDFSPTRRLMDIGGGTGSFLPPLLRSYAGLHAALVELPQVADVARARLKAHPLGERVEVVDADVLCDPLPSGCDAALVANVMHVLSPEHNLQLLRNVRAHLEPGNTLLLVDMWTDPTHTQPPLAALMAGEFLTITGEGDVYSALEVQGWLREAGFTFLEQRPVSGINSLIIAVAH